jgi:hypothetical protein
VKPERLSGAYDNPDDTMTLGWSAVVSPASISVVFPNRHWQNLEKRPARADGLTWAEADVNGLCEAIRQALMTQLAQEEA